MGLGSALVDQARTVSRRAQPTKVDGTTLTATVHGDWWRCRLELDDSREAEGPQNSPMRVNRAASLMTKGPVAPVSFADKVEVDSPQLGRGIWHVVGAPKPMRKKRAVIGWQFPIQRLDEGPAADPPGAP